uniref:Transmembrane and coiled-coil domain-containing protein 4 n=2 Tax=Caenorhabditis japonica TaxID=281687 RepID=A0A8R1E2S5_CAEJA
MKTHLEGVEELTDIAPMIMSVREDPIYKTEGSIPFLTIFLTAFVGSGNYDSRYRVLLRHLTTLLNVVWRDFEDVEDSLANTMLDEQFVESEKSRQIREKTARNKKIKRYLMIGAAGGVGGVLIGLTGGLAAPLVAASAGMLIGGGTAVAGLATTAGAAVLGTTMGVAGAGFTGYKMKKRVGAIEEFTVETLYDGVSLSCTLVVSGWIESDTSPEQAFVQQWRHLRHTKEQYTLRYESNYLMELGNAIEYLMSFAVSVAIQQTLLETALAGLVSAVAWPVALMSVSSVLDNPWNVCISRAAEVGEHLAEVLLSRSHGKRPISLIGFSLGARVIFHCLLTMSKRSESVGIIEDVILLGAPVTASPKEWQKVCSVVSGRVINGYCETDWLLRFLYRTMSAQIRIAGTGSVDNRNNKKIYNYNLSHIVKGHLDYSKRLTEVLHAVGVKVGPHSDESAVDLTQLEGPYEATGQAEEAINCVMAENLEKLAEDHASIEEVKVLDRP